jgi:hypothetical protein
LLGQVLEKQYKATLRRNHKSLTNEEVHTEFLPSAHTLFQYFLCLWRASFILLLPAWVQGVYDVLLVGLSTLC